MRKHLLTFIISCYSLGVMAQNTQSDTLKLKEIVVTGTKYPIPIEKSGKTIYKLTKKDIEENAGKSVADLLNEVPGIQMDGNFGTPGTNFDYFIRGASSQETLVLIDGIPINDPSGINLSYDFRQLPVNQIESIEVLKGGLSTLYGTGAAAAVISITLKEPVKDDLGGTVELGAASFGTFSQNFDISGNSKGFTYFISASNLTSEGFSAALDGDPNVEFDDDGLRQKNALLKLGYQFSDKLKVGFISGYDDFEADFDGGEFFDAPDNVQETDQWRFGVNASYQYERGQISFNTLYNFNDREIKSAFPSQFSGRNFQLDLNNKYNFNAVFSGLIGINAQVFGYEQAEAVDFENTQFTLIDPYASLFYDSQFGLTVHAGIRMNNHNEYGTHLVYNLNPSYLIRFSNDLRLKPFASVSTAFVSPSLFQLFAPGFGNEQLEPEESFNVEAGTSLYLGERVTLNAVYFRRDETEPIVFISEFDENGDFIGGSYQNVVDEREVEGFEVDISWQAHEKVNIKANYAYINSDVESSLFRIPNDKFGVWASLGPVENLSISLKCNYTGDRTLFSFSEGGEVTLDSFNLVDVFASYGLLNGKLTVYGSVNNITDEDFIAIQGFTTRGRNYAVGVKHSF